MAATVPVDVQTADTSAAQAAGKPVSALAPVPTKGIYPKPIRLAGTLWTATVAGYVFVFGWYLQTLAWVFVGPLLPRKQRTKMLGIMARFMVTRIISFNPLWRLRVTQPKSICPLARTIVMCNHISNADPFFLSKALLPSECKFVSKASLFKVPFAGWMMRYAGDMAVHFTKDKGGWGVKKGTTRKLMEQARWYLEHDIPVAVFPEGGRSFDRTLRPFKDGFFSLAVETGASILVCAIVGSERAWPNGELLDKAEVQLAMGERFPAGAYTAETLKVKVREDMISMLEKLRNTD